MEGWVWFIFSIYFSHLVKSPACLVRCQDKGTCLTMWRHLPRAQYTCLRCVVALSNWNHIVVTCELGFCTNTPMTLFFVYITFRPPLFFLLECLSPRKPTLLAMALEKLHPALVTFPPLLMFSTPPCAGCVSHQQAWVLSQPLLSTVTVY